VVQLDSPSSINYKENRRALEQIADSLIVFPEEFIPEGCRLWRGISFKSWQRYVVQKGPDLEKQFSTKSLNLEKSYVIMEKDKIIDLGKNSNKEEIEERYLDLRKKNRVVVTSGYFDPLHHGHVELFKLSKELGDYLIVVINNDIQTKMKKGFVFMSDKEKAKIISELRCVDEVFISIDTETPHQIETLSLIKPHIFAKGGDRYSYEIPESQVCKDLGIEIIDGIGKKIQSSSELIENAERAKEQLKNS
jgi:cytidyltransferase-like protein